MKLKSIILAPLSLLWGAVAIVRGWLFDFGLLKSQSFEIPIISVGNLAVGGTGKTPHVEYILRLLHQSGLRPAMLSRGYGRKTKGYILATQNSIAEEIGDEPYQILTNCPFAVVAVCESRVKGVRALLRDRPNTDVIVLDDAYQHRYIHPGLNILLTEASRLYTHDRLLPWGRLREPAAAAHRAQAVVVTKCTGDERPRLQVSPDQSLYYSQIVYGLPYKWGGKQVDDELIYEGRRVLVTAGVAHPEPLVQHITSFGAAIVRTLRFPDHHAYTDADLQRIRKVWREMGEKSLLVTTEKDAARLKDFAETLTNEERNHLLVQPITVHIESGKETKETFNQLILNYVNRNPRNRGVD